MKLIEVYTHDLLWSWVEIGHRKCPNEYFLDVCHALFIFTFDKNIKNTEHAEDKFDFN